MIRGIESVLRPLSPPMATIYGATPWRLWWMRMRGEATEPCTFEARHERINPVTTQVHVLDLAGYEPVDFEMTVEHGRVVIELKEVPRWRQHLGVWVMP